MASRDIIGLDALEAAAWGSSLMAPLPGGTFQAKDLPRSIAGIGQVGPFTEAGQVEIVQVSVQREFRPDRLVLTPYRVTGDGSDQLDIDWAYSVLDIRVGTISLNASPNPIAAECFAQQAVGTSIRSPVTATPSIGIQLHLRRDSAVAEGDDCVVLGTFYGPSAAPGAGLGAPSPGTVGAIVGADPAGDEQASASELPQSIVGLPETALNRNTRTYVQVPIQRDVRPDRLVLARTSDQGTLLEPMPNMLVHDIRVGTISLNTTMQPAPCTAFAPLAFGTRLRAVATATPSIGIGLELTNINPAALATAITLRGGIFGPSRYAST